PHFYPKTHFLHRGDPARKSGVATQGFLQVLNTAPTGEKHWQQDPPDGWRTSYRRRAMAGWITDTQHGAGHLLARVIVNRLWQHHIGRGIVATPNDFGMQGERPTHPELLDYLARRLIRNGWRLKPIHKLIMTSAVYRQTTDRDPAREKIDPDNRWFWRRPMRRLEAEVIRDAMLSISGQLDRTFFGPGTLNDSHRRRSIYFFIKRSKLVPSLMLFDAPEPLTSLGRRQSTTVAPQALMFINNDNVRQYARGLADRLKPHLARSPRQAVEAGYRIAVGRRPDPEELKASLDFLKTQSKAYGNNRDRALVDLAQVMMALNDFIYVD
ncbi:MAG: DUF1553 domain-containing protein, partial [Phycisphaeraceae bacterium]|nr:DUF1553 domain-containing protein [Phycisphaeraceae bacterium]